MHTIKVLAAIIALSACGNSAPSSTSSAGNSARSDTPTTAQAAPPGTATPASDSTFERITTPTYDGVIVPASRLTSPDEFFGKRVSDHWTPDAAAVDTFENGLTRFLRDAKPKRSPKLHAKVSPYKRQYLGLVMGSSKHIYAQFMCREVSGWLTQVIDVLDGGDCYFEVLYNTATNKYVKVDVHGQA